VLEKALQSFVSVVCIGSKAPLAKERCSVVSDHVEVVGLVAARYKTLELSHRSFDVVIEPGEIGCIAVGGGIEEVHGVE
jgi:hypothetical protein